MTVTDIHRTDTETRADCFAVAAEALDLADFLAGPIDPDDWRHRAACVGIEGEVFFPEAGANANEARRICQGCPVRGNCLSEALWLNEREGMWGGLTALERRPLRRRLSTRTPRRQVFHTANGTRTNPQERAA